MVRNLVNFSLKVSLDGVTVGASGTRLIVYLDIVNYCRLLFHSQQQMEQAYWLKRYQKKEFDKISKQRTDLIRIDHCLKWNPFRIRDEQAADIPFLGVFYFDSNRQRNQHFDFSKFLPILSSQCIVLVFLNRALSRIYSICIPVGTPMGRTRIEFDFRKEKDRFEQITRLGRLD